jgi:hypothetical protein
MAIIVCCFFIICSILAGLGYVALLIDLEFYKGTKFENWILLYNITTYWYLTLTGLLFFLTICTLGGIIVIAIFFLYGLFEFVLYIIEWSPIWYSDFKWFIVSNWRIAQLQSGKNEKYLIGFNKKDGTTWYLYKSASHLMFYSKEQVIKDLKDIFLIYSRVFFFDKDYAYGGYKLDEDFKQLVKKEKLSKTDFGFISVRDFRKINKI